MTMKKYLDLFEAAPMPATSATVSTAKPNPTSTGVANSVTAKPVRPGDVASYVGGPVDATAQVPDTSAAISGTGSKMANNPMQDFEEDIEETVEEELAEMMRLSGLPLHEKAASKQQQKFMGMVHAMQKGEKIKGASAELKKAAKDMSKKDAKDFASTKHKGLPKKVTEDIMLDEGGNALKHVVNRFKYEVKNFMNTGDMADNLFDALYDYYLDTGEMPYGIAKAREGDPYAWVEERFYSDMGSEMSESAPVSEVAVDDSLNELARLAGLEEDGAGQFGMPGTRSTYTGNKIQPTTSTDKSAEPVSQFAADLGMPPLPFFSEKEKADYDAIKARKAAREFKPYKDEAGTYYDTAGNPKDMPSIRSQDLLSPKPNRDRDLYRMQQDQAIKNMQNEGMADDAAHSAGEFVGRIEQGAGKLIDKFKQGREVGRKLVSKDTTRAPSAADVTGLPSDKNDPTFKSAGPQPKPSRDTGLNECDDMDSEDSFNVSTNMSSNGTRSVNISAQGGKADELLQMLKMAGMRPHDDHAHTPAMVVVSGDEEMMEADRETEYANTPEEEYETVAAITRQGNDLNREKKQFADKPKLGDNPMASDEILDEELSALLDSILVREREGGAGGIAAEQPYRDERTGKMITPPRGATNPPQDPVYPAAKKQQPIEPPSIFDREKPYKDSKTGKMITPPKGLSISEPVYPAAKGSR